MNYVGVVNGDGQVVEKIVASQAHHKKIDGHAPGLSGKDLNATSPPASTPTTSAPIWRTP